MNLKYVLPVDQITDWIIYYTNKLSAPITTVKLQQLLYYCQVWHLIYLDAPLFLEDVQGWARGPIVPSQYKRFIEWAKSELLIIDTETLKMPKFKDGQESLLEHVVNKYRGESEMQTELKLFREAPFMKSRINYDIYERGTDIISYMDIIEYYGARKNDLIIP